VRASGSLKDKQKAAEQNNDGPPHSKVELGSVAAQTFLLRTLMTVQPTEHQIPTKKMKTYHNSHEIKKEVLVIEDSEHGGSPLTELGSSISLTDVPSIPELPETLQPGADLEEPRSTGIMWLDIHFSALLGLKNGNDPFIARALYHWDWDTLSQLHYHHYIITVTSSELHSLNNYSQMNTTI